jgi:hypothetical protein
MVSYLSIGAFDNTLWHTLLIQPYLEGKNNLEVACFGKRILETANTSVSFEQNLSLTDRVHHFIIGVLLCIPVINTIAMAILRHSVEPLCPQENEQAPVIFEEEELPASIPDSCDFRDKVWLDNYHLSKYFASIAAHHPKLIVGDISAVITPSVAEDTIGLYFDQARQEGKHDLAFFAHLKGSSANAFHWCLIYIDRKRRTVEFYDSKYNYGNNAEFEESLTKVAQKLSAVEGGQPYQFVRKIQKVLQPDSYQCGPWTSYFLENRAANPEVDFNLLDTNAAQPMIAAYRNRMIAKMARS